MIKIKIALKYSQLQVIVDLYNGILEIEPKSYTKGAEYRAVKSILSRVYVKLEKKLIDKKGTKKPFTVTMEYFEAYYLNNFLAVGFSFFTGDYEINALRLVTDSINKQLAQ